MQNEDGNKPTIPDAETRQAEDTEPDRVLLPGPPFAMSADCSFISRTDKSPGCFAVVQCDSCGTAFRLDLLDGAFKQCPGCKLSYTHGFIVAPEDDDGIVDDMIAHLFMVNGYQVSGMEDDDDDDDDDDGGELLDDNGESGGDEKDE
jgi:hypothetical protein